MPVSGLADGLALQYWHTTHENTAAYRIVVDMESSRGRFSFMIRKQVHEAPCILMSVLGLRPLLPSSYVRMKQLPTVVRSSRSKSCGSIDALPCLFGGPSVSRCPRLPAQIMKETTKHLEKAVES